MKITRVLVAASAVIAGAAAVGVWTYLRLPAHAMIAEHYGLNGRPNGYMPKAEGLALLPAIGAMVVMLLASLPRITPDRERLARSSGPYGLVIVGVAAIFLVSEAAIAAKALDPNFGVLRPVFFGVAVLLAVIGNFLGKVRQNNVLGIKTPWALADERVWDKTHRFTGWAMVAGAAVLAVTVLAAPPPLVLVPIMIACAAGPLLIGAAYSWRLWRQDHQA